MLVSLGHGGFGGSLEAPPNGNRTAKCSLVQQWLNAMNAPQSSYRKYLLTSSYLMFRAPPEDRTDGETSFSRLVRVGENGTFCTTRTHLAVIVKAGFNQYRN